MLEDLVKYLPKFVSDDDRKRLQELEKKKPEIYKEAEKISKEILGDLDWTNSDICKKYGLDYIDPFNPDNFAKIMLAYIKMKEQKVYEIYQKIHRKIRIR